MKVRHPTAIRAAAFALRIVMGSLARTYRSAEPGREEELAVLAEPPAILACWHSQSFLSLPFVLRHFAAKRRRLSILASHSADGELATRIAKAFGIRVTRGSSSRGGREAIRALYRELTKHNSTVLLAPDGPRGPAEECKAGALVLAQLTGRPILPVAWRASSEWRLGSWDRMHIGRPFARVALSVGSALQVPRELTAESLEEHRQRLEAALLRANDELKQLFA